MLDVAPFVKACVVLIAHGESGRSHLGAPSWRPSADSWQGQFELPYGTVGPMVSSPGYIDQYRVYTVETNVYTVKDGKLVWSVVSETFDPTNINKAVEEFVWLIRDELHSDGLL